MLHSQLPRMSHAYIRGIPRGLNTGLSNTHVCDVPNRLSFPRIRAAFTEWEECERQREGLSFNVLPQMLRRWFFNLLVTSFMHILWLSLECSSYFPSSLPLPWSLCNIVEGPIFCYCLCFCLFIKWLISRLLKLKKILTMLAKFAK